MSKYKVYFIHVILFLVTLLTTTLAGSEWIYGRYFFLGERSLAFGEWMTVEKFLKGFYFSLPFLGFLTVHEFGHYITAKINRVKVTLPYYIPLWTGIMSTIGTMGAFIAIRSPLKSRKQFFDIGIAGPLAGFVIAFGVLWYGYAHLPPKEYVFEIHPEYITEYPEEYKKHGINYEKYAYNYPNNAEKFGKKAGQKIEEALGIGSSLITVLFENFVVSDKSRIPHPKEMMHYPFLFAGFLGLLFTALNLTPVGQLDGGHILYGLLGHRLYNRVSPVLFTAFVFYAGMGMISPYQSNETLLTAIPLYLMLLYLIFSLTFESSRNILLLVMSVFTAQFVLALFFPTLQGYSGWLAFAFLLGRFLGIYHPPAREEKPLNLPRKVLGWIALLIFVLCFSPQPFVFG